MRCNICYLPIQERSSKESCPQCFNDFHRDHFAAWLLKHDYCPMCRDPLTETFRAKLHPDSESERQRLEQSLARLDGIGEMFRELESQERSRIMESRAKEFGIEKTTIGEYIKLAIPVFLLVLFVFLLIVAATS